MTFDHTSDTEPEPARRRPGRAWTVAAAAIVALIALAAVVVILATRGGDKAPPAGSAPAPSAPPVGSPSAAPLAAQDQSVPDSPPPGVSWTLFQGVALPSSALAGPTRITGPVYAGYAHTPLGALLATAQVGYRYFLTPGDGWSEVVRNQVSPGPGHDAFVVNRAKVTTTDVAPGGLGQLAGFRFVTYSPDVAVIQLVSRFSCGTLQVSTDTVQWINGDWQLQLQPDGGSSPTAQRVDTLAGFVPWGGV